MPRSCSAAGAAGHANGAVAAVPDHGENHGDGPGNVPWSAESSVLLSGRLDAALFLTGALQRGGWREVQQVGGGGALHGTETGGLACRRRFDGCLGFRLRGRDGVLVLAGVLILELLASMSERSLSRSFSVAATITAVLAAPATLRAVRPISTICENRLADRDERDRQTGRREQRGRGDRRGAGHARCADGHKQGEHHQGTRNWAGEYEIPWAFTANTASSTGHTRRIQACRGSRQDWQRRTRYRRARRWSAGCARSRESCRCCFRR